MFYGYKYSNFLFICGNNIIDDVDFGVFDAGASVHPPEADRQSPMIPERRTLSGLGSAESVTKWPVISVLLARNLTKNSITFDYGT